MTYPWDTSAQHQGRVSSQQQQPPPPPVNNNNNNGWSALRSQQPPPPMAPPNAPRAQQAPPPLQAPPPPPSNLRSQQPPPPMAPPNAPRVRPPPPPMAPPNQPRPRQAPPPAAPTTPMNAATTAPPQRAPMPAAPPQRAPMPAPPPQPRAPAPAPMNAAPAAPAAVKVFSPEVVVNPPPGMDTPLDPNAPAPLCAERLNIVVVASECAPFAKTGGLGDVAAALPKALQRRGHRVMVVMPRYKDYEGALDTKVRVNFNVLGSDTQVGYFHMFKNGVDTVFIDHPCFHAVKNDIYAGERGEANFRNALLCQAAIEAVWHVPCGGYPYGDSDLVYMANDWHTSLLPVYLQAFYQDHGKLEFARSVFVIHNMAFQGRGPLDEFSQLQLPDKYRDDFVLDDPFGGECMNCLQAGLRLATKVGLLHHSSLPGGGHSIGYAWTTVYWVSSKSNRVFDCLTK